MLKPLISPLVLSAFAILIAPAEAANLQTTSFVDFSTRNPIPNSVATLTRTGNVLDFNLQANGLQDGAYTIWWGVFNNPSACTVPYLCTAADDLNPSSASNSSVFRVSGGTVGVGGTTGNSTLAAFNATVQVGTFPDPNAVRFGPGLLDPSGEIHPFIRYHGPVIPGQEIAQTTTFFGGCPPNNCNTIQEGVFASTSIPESSSVFGLLGFGLLGVGAILKRNLTCNHKK